MALMLQIHIRILSSVNTQDLAFNAYASDTMVIAHMNLPHKMHWIDTVPVQTAHTATSWLRTRDTEPTLVATSQGLGSGSLAVNIQESVAADPTVQAPTCTPHTGNSLGKRRTAPASMEVGCGSLSKSAHKQVLSSLNRGEPAVRTAHADGNQLASGVNTGSVTDRLVSVTV